MTQKSKKGRLITVLLFAAAVAMTLLAQLHLGALWYAYRDMRHEGLTYSQWYEGSISGYYGILMLTIVAVQLAAAVWFAFVRRVRGPRVHAKKPVKTGAAKAVCAVFAVLAAAALWRMIDRQNAYAYALTQNHDAYAGYIKWIGQARIAALLAGEGFALSLLRLLRLRRQA